LKTQEFLTSHVIGIISDLDGVAYRGDTAIPSSVRAFRAWHEQGVPYAFVTNNATKSAAQFAAIEQALVHLGTARRNATSANVGPLS
jgi:4-nitrophenyl phosphatase